ncbi:amidase [Paraburkholderia unamae]|uniref:Amidase n=1 Tax=Paraburkholderia unamae TaxID=219649 RepID=A0ABX5KWL6_9BURK|nr:amidase [Paraburkholderia unamae]PVX86608.1 amidase [Paraburkholderia unamae]CAG9273747.1 Glutamyl-tRNA(Gln) amidotransferase subunit A [Paraburkholderia unamae]
MIDRRHFLKLSGKAASAALLAATATRTHAASASVPSPDDPAWLSATELLARFRTHQLSPVDVLEAQIKRIGIDEGRVGCITVKHFDEARAAANESAARYKAGNPRPLEGITVAVKDEFAVKGWTTTMGSMLLKDAPPEKADNPVIERLRAAGAVFHVQTTVPEFYTWLTTATKLWGVTRNPWNLAYTPGGSSGGAGAALAAGFTTLALGSDMGGSIRVPASQCGLYGFKPPFGRVPTSEVPYETEGPLARTFDDLNLFTNAMVGPHPLVLSSLRPRLIYPEHYDSVKGWKIAYDPMPGISPLDPPVREAMNRAIERVKGLGATVETVDLGFKADDLDTFWAGLFSTSMGGMRTEGLKHLDQLMPYTRASFTRLHGQIGPDALVATEELLNQYQRQVQETVFTRGYRALLTPTVATPLIPAEHGLNPETDSVMIQGRRVTGLKFVFTWVWNLLGAYPVVAAPIGIDAEGMPMGMQIVGNTYDDLDAFQLASAYSRVAPPLYTGNQFPDFRNQKA